MRIDPSTPASPEATAPNGVESEDGSSRWNEGAATLGKLPVGRQHRGLSEPGPSFPDTFRT